MNIFQSSLRTISISFDGAREAVMAIAERVTRRVQLTKLQLQAQDAEERLRQAQEALGQCLYTAHAAPSLAQVPVATNEGALPLCDNIRAEQHRLQAIRERLASQQDETLSLALSRLQDDLQVGGGSMERVTIPPTAQADGRPLCEVALPESVRIALIRRSEDILVPSEQVVLRAGDQVTVIGTRSALPSAVQALLVPLP